MMRRDFLWGVVGCATWLACERPAVRESAAVDTSAAALVAPRSSCGVSLVATLIFQGSEHIDGTATLPQPIRFSVPASIPITSGGSKNGKAQLSFSSGGGSSIVCDYALHGAASSFSLDGCSDGAGAGAVESADTLVLDIANADHGAGTNDSDRIQITAALDAPDGTLCSGTNACFQSYACQAGECTGSNPVVCAGSDACHAPGTCSPSTGQCSNPAEPDGTACTIASGAGTCQGGNCTASCAGTSAVDITFDALNTSGGAVTGAALLSYLAQYGISVAASPDVRLNVQQAPYWEPTSSSPNILNAFGDNATLYTGLTYTFTFACPTTTVSFYRAGIQAGSTMGAWSATAYSATQQVLSSVGENYIVSNVPPTLFTLTGPAIAYVTFYSNVMGFAGTYLSIDDLTLSP